MNEDVGGNQKPPAYNVRTKVTQWRNPARKLLLTEAFDGLDAFGRTTHGQPVVGYGSPLSQRHGRAIFHGNVPNNTEMMRGSMKGSNVSTVFMDGHAEGIDQDLAFNPDLFYFHRVPRL
jgi:hypothetical protein